MFSKTPDSANSITLKTYDTFFIDGKTVYSLVPFEKIDVASYAANQLTDYQKSMINQDIRVHYSQKNGEVFQLETREGKILDCDKSFAQQKAVMLDNNFRIVAPLQSCYMTLFKSVNTDRMWLLHYDPLSAEKSRNKYEVDHYTRPNFCELNPKIPYELPDAAIREDEKVDVIVFHTLPSYDQNKIGNMKAGYFDELVVRDRLGEKINSIECISLRLDDEHKKGISKPLFDVRVYPIENRVEVLRQADNEIIINKNLSVPAHNFTPTKT